MSRDRWLASFDHLTGCVDKNGTPIYLGDKIVYQKKVPSETIFDNGDGHWKDVPGKTQATIVEVIGCEKKLKFKNSKVFKIEYLIVSTLDRNFKFRIYRSDKTEVLYAR